MADKNYLSFSGTPDGAVWRTVGGECRQIFPAFSPGEIPYSREWIEGDVGLEEFHHETHDDTLKFSGVKYLAVRVHPDVFGGREDVIDINNECQFLDVMLHRAAVIRGSNFLTVKGGSTDIQVVVKEVVGEGSYCEVEVGNYSEQSGKVTDRVDVFVAKSAHPIRTVFGNARRVSVLPAFGSDVKIVHRPLVSLGLKAYVFVKSLFFPPEKK